MDEQVTLQILELLQTMQKACPVLGGYAENGKAERFQGLCAEMCTGLESILFSARESGTGGGRKLSLACQSVLDTVRRVKNGYMGNREACLKKIEFELLPLLQEAYLTYYFFQYLADHPEHLPEYYEKEKGLLCGNAYIDQAMETGAYPYEVSFVVLAYNKLDYTKRCVESLLKNIPAGLRYELILINHGSSDGTKEYFESIHPHKQLDIAANGGGVGAYARIVEGEFVIFISNDVIILPNAIENLLACIRSDPKIAWAVPATPNVSNFQAIPAQYGSETEMDVFARQNNKQDPFRWEQRVRLCNPADIFRSSVMFSSKGLCPVGHYHTADPIHSGSFPDDRYSLILRRNGYKIMLAKDAYCHHFGSVTLKDEIRQQNEKKYYADGRRQFFRAFGVDPWGIGCCYDAAFADRLVGNHSGHVEILGVNCGLGSNPLKLKEQVKEFCHNTDVCLSNVTSDPAFLKDLAGVGDRAAEVHRLDRFKQFLSGQKYDYIVWEAPFLTGTDQKEILRLLRGALRPAGRLFINKAYGLGSLVSARRGAAGPRENWRIYFSKDRERRLKSIGKTITLPARIQLLNGGLGNQAFQYIFARFAELQNPGKTWYFDDSEFFIADYHNGYELDKVFGVQAKRLSNYFEADIWKEIIALRKEGHSMPQIFLDMGLPVTVMAETADCTFAGKRLHTPANGYHPEITKLPDLNVYYHGYWINKNWFAAYRRELLSELTFPALLEKRNIEYAEKIQGSLSVGIHIRRGDFVEIGWAMPDEYYRKACEQTVSVYPDARFFVFTDDVEWCGQNADALGLNLAKETVYITGNMNPNNYIDMQLLSMCRGIVMSRSSFCYLAALLDSHLQFAVNPTSREI